ncbi:MAG: peptidylprolyl isomerase [bacterium]
MSMYGLRNMFHRARPFQGLAGILLIVLATLLYVSNHFSSAEEKEDRILVTVNSQKITSGDFLDFYKTRPRIATWNSTEKDADHPKEILQALIDKILMAQKARALFPDALKHHESEVAGFEQRCLIDALGERKIEQGIEISDQEIRQRIPESRTFDVHLRRIVVATEEEARQIKKQLEGGADFASLAKKHSLGEEAEKGGDIGYMGFDQGIFPKKVVEDIFRLKDREIGDPARIREGYALFQVMGRRKVDAATSDRNRQLVKQQILMERKRERWDQFIEQARQKSSVIINEDLFTELGKAMAQQRGDEAIERMKDLEAGRVEGRIIRLREIIPDQLDFPSRGTKPWANDASLLRKILDRQIKILLVADYARQLNYHQLPEVKKNVARFKDDLMVRKLITEEVYKDLTVSREDCRAYYQQHLSEYRVPEQIRIDQIVVQDEKLAGSLLHQVKQGADFEKLAQKFSSEDALKLKNFFARGESGMGDEFEKQVFGLRPGEVSDIIKTSSGFHVVKVLERQEEGGAEFADVESPIRDRLLQTRKEKALQGYLASLRQGSRIKVNEPLFQKIVHDAL